MNSPQLALAIQLHRAGELRRAEAAYRQILAADKSCVDAWHLLGLIALAERRYGRAVELIGEATRLKPDVPRLFVNLAAAQRGAGRLAEAEKSYCSAVSLAPKDVQALHGLGCVLSELGRHVEAAQWLTKVVELRPEIAAAQNNLGVALLDQGDLASAESRFREAIQIKPEYAVAYVNLGKTLNLQGRLEEAEASFQSALRHRPDLPEAHFDLGCLWLLKGELARGWPNYAWGRKLWKLVPRACNKPEWMGEPFDGKTLLLFAEQGLGDTIQFIRYVPRIKALGGRLIVACNPPLMPLLSRFPGVDELLPLSALTAAPPAFHIQASLLDLPRIMGTTLDSIPADVPYLAANPGLVEHWRQRLAGVPGRKIGVAWQGNPTFRLDHFRSVPLKVFAPLAALAGASLISLQKGPGTEQLGDLTGKFNVLELGNELDESAGSFMDTAAAMKVLDLVITSDTSIAHLAGALGVRVWVALSAARDWRWMLDREDSSWYPTMRLFR